MAKKGKHILEAIRPIYILSRITGTIAIKRNKSGELTKSYPQSFLSVFYFVIFTIPAFYHYESAFNFSTHIEISTIIYASSTLFIFINIAFLITAVVLTNCHTKQIITIMENLFEIDKALENMGAQNQLLEANYSAWKHIRIALILFALYALPTNGIGFICNINSEIMIINFFIVHSVNFSTKLQYYFATRIFYFRFKQLNDFLKVLVNESRKSAKYPLVEKSFEKDIRDISKVHKKLVDSAGLLNNAYSFTLLFDVVLYTLTLLNSGYFIVFNIIVNKHLNFFFFFLTVTIVLLLIYNLGELLVLIRSTILMCYEVRKWL